MEPIPVKAQVAVVDGGSVTVSAVKVDEVGGVFENVSDGGWAPSIEGMASRRQRLDSKNISK
ncbi:hypothetical protein SESBI_10729 [Sesbania bispinosa]|nr:hypothetical protein SESBI_10729 [Sesbania bispinosa]